MWLEGFRWNQHGCDKATRDEIDTHHERSANQQLFCTSHPASGDFLCVILVTRDKRHHGYARLESREAKRKLREVQQRESDQCQVVPIGF